MAEVELTGLRKIYSKTVTAVHDMSLLVPHGQLVVLVGPSGCGKTTTLRMIAGLEQPTGGSIRIGSRDVSNVAPHARDVAMVFQHHVLYPYMSVAQNLRYPLQRRRKVGFWSACFSRSARDARKDESQAIERTIEKVASQLDIDTCLHRRPWQLSGGQRQRVALGRALVREPAVFLLDEPLGHLDPRLKVSLRAELRQWQKQSDATMILVTHDHEEAMALADIMVIMNEGRIHQIGTPSEIQNHPADSFVASFLDCS